MAEPDGFRSSLRPIRKGRSGSCRRTRVGPAVPRWNIPGSFLSQEVSFRKTDEERHDLRSLRGKFELRFFRIFLPDFTGKAGGRSQNADIPFPGRTGIGNIPEEQEIALAEVQSFGGAGKRAELF